MVKHMSSREARQLRDLLGSVFSTNEAVIVEQKCILFYCGMAGRWR